MALGNQLAPSGLQFHHHTAVYSLSPWANAQIPAQPHWTHGDRFAHVTAEETGFRLSKGRKTSQLMRIRPGCEFLSSDSAPVLSALQCTARFLRGVLKPSCGSARLEAASLLVSVCTPSPPLSSIGSWNYSEATFNEVSFTTGSLI